MNDKKIADYDSSLGMINPNRSYMDKYPDWAQRAEISPGSRVSQAEELLTEEQLQKFNQQINNAVNKELKEHLDKYMNQDLKPIGLIDTANYPQNIPDEETCEILDDLLSKNQLQSRVVKYGFVASNGEAYMTEPFTEYGFDGRKFIRVETEIDQPDNITLSNGEKISKGKFHWIEVKPTDYSKTTILNQTEEEKRK